MASDAVGKGNDSEGSGAGRVRVFARVRPAAASEGVFGPAVTANPDIRRVRVRCDTDAAERLLSGESFESAPAPEQREFAFDGVFADDASQREVFTEVGLPVLRECLQGFNGAILAYGQTGSGKTHSLLHQGRKSEEAGLLPRLVANLFLHISQDAAHVYQVDAAAVQVYNEQVDDLLHPDHAQGAEKCQGLAVRDGGVMPGLTWIRCAKPDEMLDAFTKARSSIVYAETRMNKASSRSHGIFQIRITRRGRSNADEALTNADAGAGGPRRLECTHARLCVVDLAGSERVKKSGVEGAQFKEAAAINRSLLAFGNVVSALAAKRPHIPFRDSKLTRILDGAVGGNCKTALLVCASPASEHSSETLGTFEFASRAMRVEVNATVNRTVVEVGAQALLADLSGESGQGAVPLAPELAQLRRESSKAAAKAAEEVRRREEAVTKANHEIAGLKHVADDAQQRLRKHSRDVEEREQSWRAEEAVLVEKWKAAEEEVDRLREAAIESVAAAITKQHTLAAEAKDANAAAEAAETRARKAEAQAETAEAEVRKASAAVEAAESRSRESAARALAAEAKAKESAALQQEVQSRCADLEAQVRKACATDEAAESRSREASACANAAEAKAKESAALQEEAQSRCVDLEAQVLQANQSATQAEQQAQQRCKLVQAQAAEAKRAETAARQGEEEADRKCVVAEAEAEDAKHAETAARQGEEEADRKCVVAEAEAQRLQLALEQNVEASEERVAEQRLNAEFKQKEIIQRHRVVETDLQAALKDTGFWRERSGVAETRIQELERLNDRVDAQESRLQKDLADACAKHREAEVTHSAALEAQRLELEGRRDADRQQFDARLAHVEARADADRVEFQQQSEQQAKDAVDRHNLREKRLAAIFKAARLVQEEKERQLKEAYDELSCRLEGRESRHEDLSELATQQSRLQEAERSLQNRGRELEEMRRQLENRDVMDRVFGAPELRRSSPCRAGSPNRRPTGPIPPLPGKKIGDSQPFPERDRERDKRQRAASERRADERARPPQPSSIVHQPAVALAPLSRPSSGSRSRLLAVH